MPPRTTSQIIAEGNYLQPAFNPNTLTIAHLIGILVYHQIQYPSQHNKAQLVEIFEDQVKGNRSHLIEQRLEWQKTPASVYGIVDGVTGFPIESSASVELVRASPSPRISCEPPSNSAHLEPPKQQLTSE